MLPKYQLILESKDVEIIINEIKSKLFRLDSCLEFIGQSNQQDRLVTVIETHGNFYAFVFLAGKQMKLPCTLAKGIELDTSNIIPYEYITLGLTEIECKARKYCQKYPYNVQDVIAYLTDKLLKNTLGNIKEGLNPQAYIRSSIAGYLKNYVRDNCNALYNMGPTEYEIISRLRTSTKYNPLSNESQLCLSSGITREQLELAKRGISQRVITLDERFTQHQLVGNLSGDESLEFLQSLDDHELKALQLYINKYRTNEISQTDLVMQCGMHWTFDQIEQFCLATLAKLHDLRNSNIG